MDDVLAVHVKNASKSYSHKKVLTNLNLHVATGSIYALLGASGCGKTTLLSCIVGRQKLNSGEIWVLGEKRGILGPIAGYMPQELALVGELTVEDTIYYFGRIFNMPDDVIERRKEELNALLNLPPKDRYIKNCSGGEQRRVSFAASMVHLPELLILDEPTVGLDPVLREKLWDYLVKIVREKNVAVVITTHYIEEARQAHRIGLMRNGTLLAEDSPTALLERFETDVLQDVFLTLSQQQNKEFSYDNPTCDESSGNNISLRVLNSGSNNIERQAVYDKIKKKKYRPRNSTKRIQALLGKNFKHLYRNTWGMIFLVTFPIVQHLIFLNVIGSDIKDIKLAIINEETNTTRCRDFHKEGSAIPYDYTSCHLSNMSCRFLEYLENPMIYKIKFDSVAEAIEGIKHGRVIGAIHMSKNLTESMETRSDHGFDAEDDVLTFSTMKVWLDMSNRQIGGTLKFKLLKLFTDFSKDLKRDCKNYPRTDDTFRKSFIHGSEDDKYTEMIIPGMTIILMSFMMTMTTSQLIVAERSEGFWDRNVIAGVSTTEICLTHLIFQIPIIILFTIESMLLTFVVFDNQSKGSYWILTMLTFLQGVDGFGIGFWISIISYNITMAMCLTQGTFYLTMLISGMIWPLEAMPTFLQWISNCFPFAMPMISFRNVMKKGWSLSYFDVWTGVCVEVVWIIMMAVLNMLLIHIKK